MVTTVSQEFGALGIDLGDNLGDNLTRAWTVGDSMDDLKSWFLVNEDKLGENRFLRTPVTSCQELGFLDGP